MGKREGRQVWVKDLGIKVAKRRDEQEGRDRGDAGLEQEEKRKVFSCNLICNLSERKICNLSKRKRKRGLQFEEKRSTERKTERKRG
ncbi:hypothetical protein D8674_026320 [Pyrus ussuriensis x Pyrus communis]|uniref:Uncharacterized protein n=1 Tax=Pyrus ussuriensis x Pyrus communis TaxID=2448454 RepID=A0A5N5I6L2_9ROSA|nr:hypothetical protein D8674_026320 [Pyrus ussuriensis x Pyrus communis]